MVMASVERRQAVPIGGAHRRSSHAPARIWLGAPSSRARRAGLVELGVSGIVTNDVPALLGRAAGAGAPQPLPTGLARRERGSSLRTSIVSPTTLVS